VFFILQNAKSDGKYYSNVEFQGKVGILMPLKQVKNIFKPIRTGLIHFCPWAITHYRHCIVTSNLVGR